MSNIKVNVMGREFEVPKKILLAIPYFSDMIHDCNDDKMIFVGRSSKLFEEVLQYVVDKSHPYPAKYEYELKFYGVEYNVIELYAAQKAINDKINNLYDLNKKFENALINIGHDMVKRQFDCIKTGCTIAPRDHRLKCDSCINKCAYNSCKATTHKTNYCDKHMLTRFCNYYKCNNLHLPDESLCFEHFNL